jgi:hypothetical protein
VQLIGEVRQPIRAEPRQIERYNCEYGRNDTANLFVFVDVNRPWRKMKVTERRAAEDFAACMRELADVHYPEAERIRMMLDNLSTHSAGALHQTFPPDEARRVLPIGVPLRPQARQLAEHGRDRRPRQPVFSTAATRLLAETAAWENRRNAQRACINWIFTTEKARAKMGRAS